MLKKYALIYGYSAYAPVISEKTMRVHYDKHYTGYLNKANEELERLNISDDMNEIIENRLYEKSQKLKDNFGGYYNHSLFWYMISPPEEGSRKPLPNTERFINQDFGSFFTWKEAIAEQAKKRFGSGWVWWVFNPKTRKTEVINTPYQDFPEMEEYGGKIPLFGIDVWEHAYYLDYENMRERYVNNILLSLVNWDYVEERLNTVLQKYA